MPKELEIYTQWQAPQFVHYEKNASWYGIFSLVVIGLIAILIWRHDLFGAISIGVVAVIALIFSRHKPEIIDIAISNYGIHSAEHHISHTNIKHFWIVDNNRHRTLNVHTDSGLGRIVIFQLGDADGEAVRAALSNFAQEHEGEETLAQKIMHKFRY
jgi:hypothetical protein